MIYYVTYEERKIRVATVEANSREEAESNFYNDINILADDDTVKCDIDTISIKEME